MTKNNTTCSEAMTPMFVLVGRVGRRERSENKFKLKTVFLQNKTVGGDRKIFVGKVAVFSHVLNWRIKLDYRVHCCQ